MEAIKFGMLSVEETDHGIRFDLLNSSSADLDTAEIPVLLGFLKKHLEVSSNRRSSWRLTLTTLGGTDADKLEVSINTSGHEREAKAIDISLTGMFLEIPEPVGERGDTLAVSVAFEGTSASLNGTIVRQDTSMKCVAVDFPECMDAQGALCPPDSYREIFTRLEQIWLDRKLGLVWT